MTGLDNNFQLMSVLVQQFAALAFVAITFTQLVFSCSSANRKSSKIIESKRPPSIHNIYQSNMKSVPAGQISQLKQETTGTDGRNAMPATLKKQEVSRENKPKADEKHQFELDASRNKRSIESKKRIQSSKIKPVEVAEDIGRKKRLKTQDDEKKMEHSSQPSKEASKELPPQSAAIPAHPPLQPKAASTVRHSDEAMRKFSHESERALRRERRRAAREQEKRMEHDELRERNARILEKARRKRQSKELDGPDDDTLHEVGSAKMPSLFYLSDADQQQESSVEVE